MQDSTEKTNPNLQPDRQLNFKVRDTDVVVSLSDVASLFNDMERYNSKFSAGAMLARMVRSQIEVNLAEDNGDTETVEQAVPTITEEEGNQQINAFFLVSKHKQLLDKIGLSLEAVAGKGQAVFSEDGQAGIGEIRVNVNDQENFTSFLEVLTPQQLNQEKLKDGFESVAGILVRQVLDKYDLNMPEDEAMQLFMGMEKIVGEYQRLGMGKAVEQLGVYLEHGKIGDLREYVAIQNKHLFGMPGKSFGPGDWQKDSSPDWLEGKWNDAIDTLEMTNGNPKAIALSEQLRQHLILCVNAALENTPTLGYLNEESKRLKTTVLEVAKQKLEMMSAS